MSVPALAIAVPDNCQEFSPASSSPHDPSCALLRRFGVRSRRWSNHPRPAIARKRSPETFEKRRRALDKQRKRKNKIADRVERNAEKKMIKDGTLPDPETTKPEPPPYDWRDDFKLGNS